jgi:hypothetical protein
MPQNTNITVPPDTWTLLTDADVTAVTFQNMGNDLLIKGTVGAVAPTTLLGAVSYFPGGGERNVLLSDLFPGVSGRNRLYAYSPGGTSVFVSHA